MINHVLNNVHFIIVGLFYLSNLLLGFVETCRCISLGIDDRIRDRSLRWIINHRIDLSSLGLFFILNGCLELKKITDLRDGLEREFVGRSRE
jgi:hypothetical protein